MARKKTAGWPSAKYMLGPFVARYGDRSSAELGLRDWGDYREQRAELAPGSRNFTLAKIKAMLRWALADGLLLSEPAICSARTEPQKDHRETAPTEADNQRVLAEVTKARELVIVLCATDAGMRRNEIRQLQWPWVAVDGERITIPNWAAKGGKGRTVPATYRLYSAIRTMPRDIRSEYVITNPDTGQPYCKAMFTKWSRELIAASGIQPAPGEVRVRLHDLRHGYATNAVERGVRIEVVSDILGHASLEQTRAYVQRRPGDLSAARETFQAGIERDRTRR